MEMKIKGDTFYYLDTGFEKLIYDDEKDALQSLKTLVSTKKITDFEVVSFLEVNIAKDDWKIKSVPWSKIAMEIMKEG